MAKLTFAHISLSHHIPDADKLKSLSPKHRFVIAKHPLHGIVETGPPIRLAEKSAGNVPAPNLTCRFLWSGLGKRFTELRQFLKSLAEIRQTFSAIQTGWRREEDSNSRYPF